MRITEADARRAARLGTLALAALVLRAGPVPAAPPPAPPAPARTMAITVDDLPAVPASDLAEMRRITSGMLDVLRRHGVAAVGFVNENKLEPAAERTERVALLQAWLSAGHDLGNHTYSHPDLQHTLLAEYEEDVLLGEVATRSLLAARGRALVWFRHPFTHTGPTREVRRAFETFLAERGYRVAPFSIENADYIFERLRRDAAARADAVQGAQLRAAYANHTLVMTEHMEALARDTFGREIPQVLLLHANWLNVETLDTILERLAARGYRFVPLEQALRDEAWGAPDEFVGAQGPSWLHRFRVARKLPSRLELEPDPPAWVLDRYHAVQGR